MGFVLDGINAIKFIQFYYTKNGLGPWTHCPRPKPSFQTGVGLF